MVGVAFGMALAACGEGSADGGLVTVEVGFHENVPPFTSAGSLGENPWSLFKDNIEAVFSRSGLDINVPTQVGDANDRKDDDGNKLSDDKLEDLAKRKMLPFSITRTDRFSARDIVDVSKQVRLVKPTDSKKTLHVMLLPGFFEDIEDNKVVIRERTLGVQIHGKGIIAIFMDVLQNTYDNREGAQLLALTHEFGHYAGLVNHEDHGVDHCTNTDCIMFFELESSSGVNRFLSSHSFSGDPVLFGPDCLDDIIAVRDDGGLEASGPDPVKPDLVEPVPVGSNPVNPDPDLFDLIGPECEALRECCGNTCSFFWDPQFYNPEVSDPEEECAERIESNESFGLCN